MAECRQCGEELPEDAQFCPGCGAAVPPGGPQPPDEEAPVGDEVAPQAPLQATRDDRNIATLIHLSAFAGFLFPFGNIIAPLVIWLLKREESPFIDAHGKAAVNFQISFCIYMIVSIILIVLVIGIPLIIAITIFGLVVVIIAAIRANEGSQYTYPLAIPFIR